MASGLELVVSHNTRWRWRCNPDDKTHSPHETFVRLYTPCGATYQNLLKDVSRVGSRWRGLRSPPSSWPSLRAPRSPSWPPVQSQGPITAVRACARVSAGHARAARARKQSRGPLRPPSNTRTCSRNSQTSCSQSTIFFSSMPITCYARRQHTIISSPISAFLACIEQEKTKKFPMSLIAESMLASSSFSADLGPTPGTSVSFLTSCSGVLWKVEFFCVVVTDMSAVRGTVSTAGRRK